MTCLLPLLLERTIEDSAFRSVYLSRRSCNPKTSDPIDSIFSNKKYTRGTVLL